MAKDTDKTKLTGAASIVREEDLEDMTALEHELQERIDKAREDGRTYMMAQFVRMLAMIKSESTRIRARFDREVLANMRREHKELRLADREAREERDRERETA
jgi:hypothetical protein